MTRKRVLNLLQLLVFAAVGGGIVWYMLAHMTSEDRKSMIHAIGHSNLLWLIPFFIVYLIAQWARAKRWMLMLDPVGIHPKTSNTVFAVMVGYLVNMIPPRAGEVAKCTLLAEYEHMPADKMIGTIVAERSFDVVCLVLVTVVAFFWQGIALSDYLQNELVGRTPSVRSLILTGACILLVVAVLAVIYRRNKNSKIGHFIGGLGVGFTSIFHLKKRGQFLLHTSIIWVGYVVQLMFGFQSMAATSNLGAGEATMTLIFGSVAIIGTPGGIGLYPFLVGKLLHSGYGLSLPDANAFGWLSWIALTVATLISGITSLFLLPLYNRKPHDSQAPVDTEQNP
jgi:uncharacterized membrane protein YbhN (UPF0104 family)